MRNGSASLLATCITSGLRGVPWAWEPEPCECACCVEAEGEDVYETCPPEEMARKRDPLTAGVLLVASTSKAAHISETVWNGSGMVMRRPGYRVGISEGYCRLTTPRTLSMTIASLGLKRRSVPRTMETRCLKARRNALNSVRSGTPNEWSCSNARPWSPSSK